MEIIACPDCDLLQRVPELTPGGKARCPRCQKTLVTQLTDPLDRTLALALAAAIVFILANVAPLMRLSAVGRFASTTIAGGVYEMWLHGAPGTAVIVAFCAVIAPGSYILSMLAVLLSVKRPPAPQWVGEMLRWADSMQPWSMNEVMILGILVALIKIAELATVDPGIGMYGVGGLVVLFAAIRVSFDPGEVWKRVTWIDNSVPQGLHVEWSGTLNSAITAAKAGLISCEKCDLLSQPINPAEPGHCPRCGQELEWRRHHSIQRTWALVIGAAICYIPANILPVLNTTTLGSTDSDTIMGGVVFLYTSGSWPLALIVLIASVMVPLGKLAALSYLLITVQRNSLAGGRERTRLYRMVEFIGRWSMLDVFVDTFTVALVQLAPLMSVQPGPGVLFFAAVVVLTMLAADSFDPRLIWDSSANQEPSYG
jgi:paraquat-inducible protein A